MNNPSIIQFSKHIFHNLYLCSCGYMEYSPLHFSNLITENNYSIYFILEGRADCYIENALFTIEKNQGCFIKPNVSISFEKNAEKSFTYMWIAFNGEQADFIFKQIIEEESNPLFSVEDNLTLKSILFDLLKQDSPNIKNEFFIQGLFYQFLSALMKQDNDKKSIKDKENISKYIQQSIAFIENNYCNEITVQDIADSVKVSRTYLYTLFQKFLHRSPQEFLMNFRMKKAIELLETTELSIESISFSCGYKNPVIFEQIFKTEKNITPSAYRKNNFADFSHMAVEI